jgi:putative oxidoreductase
VLTRIVALYAVPMMLGASHFWFVRNGFYFTLAGAELPLVWAALLCLQAILGDGAFALVPTPDWFRLRGRSAQRARVSQPGQQTDR